jgi:hypothetical protein
MTPASAALGVPSLADPDEGVGQGWASESTISGVSGRPQGDSNRKPDAESAENKPYRQGRPVAVFRFSVANSAKPGSVIARIVRRNQVWRAVPVTVLRVPSGAWLRVGSTTKSGVSVSGR